MSDIQSLAIEMLFDSRNQSPPLMDGILDQTTVVGITRDKCLNF